jgi:uroporphyrinogen decarboxylase
VRRVRAALPGDTALIGFAGAPWTVVCYMVEGQGSRDFAEVRNLAYRDPALFDALMQLVTLATIDYLAQQIEAGADVVMLFDSWAGVLPAAQFRRYVIEPTRQIVVALKQRYPHIPMIGFPRLAGAMLGEYALTGVQGVGVDTSADPVKAAGLVSAEIALQGNVDPLALLAGGEALADATRTVLESWRGRPFIFNLGHGVVPQTPPEHVVELARLVRAA